MSDSTETIRRDVLALHNQSIKRLIQDIVMPTVAAGGTVCDVLFLLESVVAGVLSAALDSAVVPGPVDVDQVLELLIGNVRTRMAEVKLLRMPAEGHG